MKKEMIEIAIKPQDIKEPDYDNVVDYLTETAEMFCESDDYLFAIVHKGNQAFEMMKVLMLIRIEFEISYCKVDDDGCVYYKGDKAYDD